MTSQWPVLVGYLVAVVVAHFPICWTINLVRRFLRLRRPNSGDAKNKPRLAPIVGFVERTLFVASWQLDAKEFIAVWLALKVAGQWSQWGTGRILDDGTRVHGRLMYNMFLIGTGLSIAYAVVGAKMIDWGSRHQWTEFIAVPCALLAGNACLGAMLSVKCRRRAHSATTQPADQGDRK